MRWQDESTDLSTGSPFRAIVIPAIANRVSFHLSRLADGGYGGYCTLVIPGTSAIPADEPLAGLRFCVAGPGRVGASLACWLSAAGARLTTVAGEDPRGRARELANRLGGRACALEELGGEGEDLLLVAVADHALAAVDRTLGVPAGARTGARAGGPPRARVALHTAGSRGAGALPCLAAHGAGVGSFHPLKAFPRRLPEVTAAREVVFAVDGAPEAQALARRLAAAWGAIAVEVPAADRLLYHFAATLAAGGIVTLLATAVSIGRAIGLPPAVERGYLGLAQGALGEVPATAEGGCEPAAAITGPVARGDAATVLQALERVRERVPAAATPARAIARETLRQLALRGPWTVEQQDLFDRLQALVEPAA